MDWRERLKYDFQLGSKQILSFQRLLHELQAAPALGLTSLSQPADIINFHFFDSLSLQQFPEMLASTKTVDIGSGAGFPGLPLAIAKPEMEILLIESNKKKSAFINHTVAALGLENVTVLPVRAEAAGHSDIREQFSVALARAVGSLPEVLEYAFPFLKPGGHALLQRGAIEAADKEKAIKAAGQLGGNLKRIEQVKPYPQSVNLHIWIFEKTGATPVKYPRKAGIPRKRPLV